MIREWFKRWLDKLRALEAAEQEERLARSKARIAEYQASQRQWDSLFKNR